MKKISIIIPVYNVEKYIERCINSVLNQNLNPNDYEIIIVDDESPDNSVFIIKKIMLNYSQISLFSQKNKGLGGARNTGVQHATGKYLLFLDADDYLEENVLLEITNYSILNNLDILEFGAIGVDESKKEVYKKSISTNIILDGYSYLYKNNYMNSACNKLYSSNLLKNNNLYFREKIFIEDFEFNTRVFYFAERVIGIDTIIANFVQTSNSITRNRSVEKNEKMVFDIKEVIDITLRFSNTIDSVNKIKKAVIEERIAFLTITLLFTMFKLNIDKNIRTVMIEKLKSDNLYPVKIRINDKRKNIFRVISNNELIYKISCNLKLFLSK